MAGRRTRTHPRAEATDQWGAATHWPGYAAAAWAFVFAAVSIYWALGGTAGVSTVDPSFLERADEPAAVAMLWLTAAVKVAGGLLALAFVQDWGRALPRRVLLLGGWAGGAGMALYGGLGFILDGLRVADAIEVREASETAARWHFAVWDPWWFLGGVLFLLATLQYQRQTSTTEGARDGR